MYVHMFATLTYVIINHFVCDIIDDEVEWNKSISFALIIVSVHCKVINYRMAQIFDGGKF